MLPRPGTRMRSRGKSSIRVHPLQMRGAFSRLCANLDPERWSVTPWVTLPGAPMAYALDEAGDFVVGTTNQRLNAVVCGRAGTFAPAHVVRITEDGRLAPVEPDGRH